MRTCRDAAGVVRYFVCDGVESLIEEAKEAIEYGHNTASACPTEKREMVFSFFFLHMQHTPLLHAVAALPTALQLSLHYCIATPWTSRLLRNEAVCCAKWTKSVSVAVRHTVR